MPRRGEVEGRGRRSRSAPRVLLIGAGAVGQVYGWHLQRGGARVELLLKPKHVAAARQGFQLYRITSKKGRVPETFKADAVHGDVASLRGRRFDQLWLAMSTAALARAAKNPSSPVSVALKELGQTVVALPPGLEVPDLLAPYVPPRRRVDGGVTLIAYDAPLVEDEVPEPGVAFRLTAPAPFSGANANEVVRILRAGGMKARVHPDARVAVAFSGATMLPIVVALEGAGWKLKDVRHSDYYKLAAKAGAEARRIVEDRTGVKKPPKTVLFGSTAYYLSSKFAPHLAPFDLEVYLRYHFTKMRTQSERGLAFLSAIGRRRGFPTEAIDELRSRVFAKA